MIDQKIENFLNAPIDSINIGDIKKINCKENILLYWGEEPIGKLIKGSKIYLPVAEAINSEFLASDKKLLVSAKLQSWIDNEISLNLKPIKENFSNDINSQVRAIAFNCFERLGIYPIDDFKDFLKDISPENKLQLSKLGIRNGAKFFFIPNFLKKKQIELNSILWKVYNEFNLDCNIPIPKEEEYLFIR
jgi:hypothetical protein